METNADDACEEVDIDYFGVDEVTKGIWFFGLVLDGGGHWGRGRWVEDVELVGWWIFHGEMNVVAKPERA